MAAVEIIWVGEIELRDAADRGAELDQLFGDGGDPVEAVDSVVIDLAGVTFLDSVGLGVLVKARNLTREHGIALTLRAVPQRVRRLLNLTGLAPMFTFDDPHPTAPIEVSDLPSTTPEVAEPDPAYDRIAALAARLLAAPTALVTFLDERGQVMPGAVGLPAPWQDTRFLPLPYSTCQYVVARGAPLVIPDLRADPLFAGTPAVPDLGTIAYAGMPLTDLTGRIVGSLCAIDSRPRQWTDTELADLRDLAALCSAEVHLRAARRRAALAVAHQEAERARRRRAAVHLQEVASTLAELAHVPDATVAQRISTASEQALSALAILRSDGAAR